MKTMILALALAGHAYADEKTCLVKGMECSNCAEAIAKDLCTEAYATCDVKLIDKAAHLGQIHLVTKDPANKADLKRVDEVVAKMTYEVQGCADGAPKAAGRTKAKPSVKR